MNTEMINKRMQIIEDLQAEFNKLKNMYDEALENDAEYQKVVEEAAQVKSESKEKQDKLLDKSTYKGILDQIKEKRQEIKEQQEVLSQELVDYYRESGTNEIEDSEGNVKRMKFSVKLVN